MLGRACASADEDESILQLWSLEEDPLKQGRSIDEGDAQVTDDDIGVDDFERIQCGLPVLIGVDDILPKDPADHLTDGGLVFHQEECPRSGEGMGIHDSTVVGTSVCECEHLNRHWLTS